MLRTYRLLFMSLCLLTLTWMLATPVFAVRINTLAPDFILKDLHGNNVRLSDYRGKTVILNFWSTTCEPCMAEIPSLIKLQREFKAQGLVVVGIALDSSEINVRESVVKFMIGYTNLMDSDKIVYFDSYGLFGQPISVIVDTKGIIREKIIGGIEWTTPQVKNRIQSYMKER